MTTVTRWSIHRLSGSRSTTTNRSTSGCRRRPRTCPPIASTPSSDDAEDADDESIVLTSDDELDRLDPQQHGRERGQIDGTPEDGDSFFDVVE